MTVTAADLPTEVLARVAECFVENYRRYKEEHIILELHAPITPFTHKVTPILLTCRLFHRKAMPILYSDVLIHKWSQYVSFMQNPHPTTFRHLREIQFDSFRREGERLNNEMEAVLLGQLDGRIKGYEMCMKENKIEGKGCRPGPINVRNKGMGLGAENHEIPQIGSAIGLIFPVNIYEICGDEMDIPALTPSTVSLFLGSPDSPDRKPWKVTHLTWELTIPSTLLEYIRPREGIITFDWEIINLEISHPFDQIIEGWDDLGEAIGHQDWIPFLGEAMELCREGKQVRLTCVNLGGGGGERHFLCGSEFKGSRHPNLILDPCEGVCPNAVVPYYPWELYMNELFRTSEDPESIRARWSKPGVFSSSDFPELSVVEGVVVWPWLGPVPDSEPEVTMAENDVEMG